MTRMKRVLSIGLAFILVFSIVSVVVYATTGDNIVTVVKEIIETHHYFVDDIEVTEEEYNNVKNTPTSEIFTRDIEHRISTKEEYRINGEVVTKEEFENYFNNEEAPDNNSYKKITFTAEDLTALNSGSLGDYLSFETDVYGNVISAKVKNENVCKVEYTFGDGLQGYLYNENGKTYYDCHCGGYLYPDTTNEKTFMYFKYDLDIQNKSNVFMSDTGNTKNVIVENNDCLFYFEPKDGWSSIKFSFIFDCITLYVK